MVKVNDYAKLTSMTDDQVNYSRTESTFLPQLFVTSEYDNKNGIEISCDEAKSNELIAVVDSPVVNKATLFSVYVNLTSTAVGCGVLGISHAFANTGWIGGLILLILFAVSSAFSLHLLSKCASQVPLPSSFYKVAKVTLPAYTRLIDFAVAIKCYGVATSYLIVVGDLMPAVMEQIDSLAVWRSRSFWVLTGFIVAAPLACLPRLDDLKYSSLFSLFCILFLAIIVALFALPNLSHLVPCDFNQIENTLSSGVVIPLLPINGSRMMSTELYNRMSSNSTYPRLLEDIHDNCFSQQSWIIFNTNSFKVLSVFVFAYTCQQNIFSVVNELQNPTQQRVDFVIKSSLLSTFVILLIIGGCGYYTYGNQVSSDLLSNYPGKILQY